MDYGSCFEIYYKNQNSFYVLSWIMIIFAKFGLCPAVWLAGNVNLNKKY